jgi:ABC-2 type transport system permease protein
MSGALIRVAAMALKELRVVLLDRRVLTTLVISPIVQLILFGFATTLEVKNFRFGFVNRDHGVVSEQVLSATAANRNIAELISYPNEAALGRAIERREVLGGMILPADLSLRFHRDEPAEIGVLLDGRRINASQIVAGYLNEIAGQVGASLRPATVRIGPAVAERHWFNPNLEYSLFTLPGMITLITTVVVLSVSVQAIAREREFGTWDEVQALPLRPWEILLGKCAPAFTVGVVNGTLYVLVIPLVSSVPFLGSYPLMILSIACFSLAVTGIGLAISTLAQNQQQAFLGGFLVIVPMMLLSGYASPIDGMPGWLQPIAAINPLSHMLVICHGLFLKELPTAVVLAEIWPMLGVAAAALATGLVLLRSRIS